MNVEIKMLFEKLGRCEYAVRRGPETSEANGRQTGFSGLHINKDGSVLAMWHQQCLYFPSLDDLWKWAADL